MTMRLGLATIVLGLSLSACAPEPAREPAKESGKETAGDPVKTLPESYKLEFENDYVRVVRVHYDVGARLPEHIHPRGMTFYVYLNDNEAVAFNHDGAARPLKRPPVKAGGARFQTSDEEHHTVENLSPTPSDFIRVQMKTHQGSLGNVVRRRIALSEEEFSNEVIRVTRPGFDPGKALVAPPSDYPSLIVAWPSGKHRWIDPKASASIPTGDPDTRGFVRVELLTPLKRDP